MNKTGENRVGIWTALLRAEHSKRWDLHSDGGQNKKIECWTFTYRCRNYSYQSFFHIEVINKNNCTVYINTN